MKTQTPLLIMVPNVIFNHKTRLKCRYQMFQILGNNQYKFLEEYNNIDDVLNRGKKTEGSWGVYDTALKTFLTPPTYEQLTEKK